MAHFTQYNVIPTTSSGDGNYWFTRFRATYTETQITIEGATVDNIFASWTTIGSLANTTGESLTNTTLTYATGVWKRLKFYPPTTYGPEYITPINVSYKLRYPGFYDTETPFDNTVTNVDGSDLSFFYQNEQFGFDLPTYSAVIDLPYLPSGSVVIFTVSYPSSEIQFGNQYVSFPIVLRSMSFGSNITCFRSDSNVTVFDELSGVEKIVQAKDIRKGDLVYSTKRGYVPIVANICSVGNHQNGWYIVPQGSLGPNMPSSDLHIKDTHPLEVNGKEILVKDLPQAKPSGAIDNVSYTFATEIREPVKINGADVYTWNYNDWLSFVNKNPRMWNEM